MTNNITIHNISQNPKLADLWSTRKCTMRVHRVLREGKGISLEHNRQTTPTRDNTVTVTLTCSGTTPGTTTPNSDVSFNLIPLYLPLASQGTQAYNRYGYVNNNPVRYNDPTGVPTV